MRSLVEIVRMVSYIKDAPALFPPSLLHVAPHNIMTLPARSFTSMTQHFPTGKQAWLHHRIRIFTIHHIIDPTQSQLNKTQPCR